VPTVFSGKIFERPALGSELGFEPLWSDGHFFTAFLSVVKNI